MLWRLAAALRSDLSEESVAALAARLMDVTGASLRFARRPRRRRMRMIAAARGGDADGVPVSATTDRLADVTAACLSRTGPAPGGAR